MSKTYKIYTKAMLLTEFNGLVKELDFYGFPESIINGTRTVTIPSEFRLVCLDARELASAVDWNEVMWLQTPLIDESGCYATPPLSERGLRAWVREEFPVLGSGFDRDLIKVTEW
jgi:hypothetical protein